MVLSDFNSSKICPKCGQLLEGHSKESCQSFQDKVSAVQPIFVKAQGSQEMVCMYCGGTGKGPSKYGPRFAPRCTACDGWGVIRPGDPSPEERMRQHKEEKQKKEEEYRAMRAEMEQKEKARLEALLAEPSESDGWFTRLTSTLTTPFQTKDPERLPHLKQRSQILRQQWKHQTNDRLKKHLASLSKGLQGNKSERGAAVAELTLLDRRAVPMLLDLWFSEDAPDKAKRSAYKALEQIVDFRSVFYLACFLRDWNNGPAVARLIQTKCDTDDDFDKLLPADQIRCLVGLRWGSNLRNSQKLTEETLFADLTVDDPKSIEFALNTLIGLGEESLLVKLKQALDQYGTRHLAVAYLNCGKSELADHAKAWALAHGYEIHKTGGTAPVHWGGLK